MLRHSTIHKIIAAILMIVFACSITPKKSFHDLIAAHHDTASVTCDVHGDIITITRLNCKCDNLVSEGAYLYTPVPSLTPLFPEHTPRKDYFKYHFLSCSHWFTELRGPPVGFHISLTS